MKIKTGGIKSALPIRAVEQCEAYKKDIIIDVYASLASFDYSDRYKAGGLTVICAPIHPINGHELETIEGISEWYQMIKKDEDLMLIETVNDIYTAKKLNKLGILLVFNGPNHIQDDINLLDIYYRLGLRQMVINYSTRSLIGDGYLESTNYGLSDYGRKVIERLNELGIIIDLTYSSKQTALETIAISKKPCIFSHSNSSSVYNTPRNIDDELVISCAKKGGLICPCCFPTALSDELYPTIDSYMNHINYYVKLVGIDHVGISFCHYQLQTGIMPIEEANAIYKQKINNKQWSFKTHGTPPYYFPIEVRLPEQIPNIYNILLNNGYNDEEVAKLIGGNYVRIANEVFNK